MFNFASITTMMCVDVLTGDRGISGSRCVTFHTPKLTSMTWLATSILTRHPPRVSLLTQRATQMRPHIQDPLVPEEGRCHKHGPCYRDHCLGHSRHGGHAVVCLERKKLKLVSYFSKLKHILKDGFKFYNF